MPETPVHAGVSCLFFVSALKLLERINPPPAGHVYVCGQPLEEVTYHLAMAEAAFKLSPTMPKPKRKKKGVPDAGKTQDLVETPAPEAAGPADRDAAAADAPRLGGSPD